MTAANSVFYSTAFILNHFIFTGSEIRKTTEQDRVYSIQRCKLCINPRNLITFVWMTLTSATRCLYCYNTSMWWYLLFVEALGTQLKLFIFGFHGFTQFLENLREEKRKVDHHSAVFPAEPPHAGGTYGSYYESRGSRVKSDKYA